VVSFCNFLSLSLLPPNQTNRMNVDYIVLCVFFFYFFFLAPPFSSVSFFIRLFSLFFSLAFFFLLLLCFFLPSAFMTTEPSFSVVVFYVATRPLCLLPPSELREQPCQEQMRDFSFDSYDSLPPSPKR